MKKNKLIRNLLTSFFVFILFLLPSINAQNIEGNYQSSSIEEGGVSEFRGVITDLGSGNVLAFASIVVEGTNVATVTNSEGSFLMKVPNSFLNRNIVISFIGYEKKVFPIKNLVSEKNNIGLDMLTVSLVEVSVFPTEPSSVIRAAMNQRTNNYSDVALNQKAFYRESIKKGWRFVSLTEAVVEVYKHSYNSSREDQVKLLVGRKSSNYERLDTLVFKLQGGPVTALMLDIMKDPYTLFDDEMIDYYDFHISNVTRIDERVLYEISFEQKPHVKVPLYNGKVYIDMETLAITQAIFNMNLSDREAASRILIRRKPTGARVYPTEVSYLVNYLEKDGKWYFAYSRGQLSFRVNWRRRLFNSNYHATMEIAITDWEVDERGAFKSSDRIRMNVVMEEAVSGFTNDDFWGEYNVIEPEQPIENAIKRIQRSIQ